MILAVQSQIGKFEIREVENPTPQPGEVVVRVRAALTCGTDRKILERGHVKFAPPLVMGHEFSGEVTEAGAGARFSPGDPVMAGVSGPPRGRHGLPGGGPDPPRGPGGGGGGGGVLPKNPGPPK